MILRWKGNYKQKQFLKDNDSENTIYQNLYKAIEKECSPNISINKNERRNISEIKVLNQTARKFQKILYLQLEKINTRINQLSTVN